MPRQTSTYLNILTRTFTSLQAQDTGILKVESGGVLRGHQGLQKLGWEGIYDLILYHVHVKHEQLLF